MELSFKTTVKIWAVTAVSAFTINLSWFIIRTAEKGNPWGEIIGPIPVLVMSFATTLVVAAIFSQLIIRFKIPILIYIAGCGTTYAQ